MAHLQLTRDTYNLFVQGNRATYHQLFDHFGHPWPGDDNLAGLAEATYRLWVPKADPAKGIKGEFGDPVPAGYSEELTLGALPDVVRTGLFDTYAPVNDGNPKKVYVAGRKYFAMEASWVGLDAVLATGSVPSGIAAFGSRGRKDFDGTDQELMDRAEEAGVSSHWWVKQQFSERVPFPTEGALGVLSAMVYFRGNVLLPRAMPNFGDGTDRLHRVLVEINGVPFTVTGARMIARAGYSRPTAISSALDTMDLVPFGDDDALAIISGPPHAPRVSRDTMEGLWTEYPSLTGWTVSRPATVVADDPYRAVRLGLHELALMAGNTDEAKAARRPVRHNKSK